MLSYAVKLRARAHARLAGIDVPMAEIDEAPKAAKAKAAA